MAEKTGVAAQGTVLRLVKLNVCGAPVSGSSSAVVVTAGYISLQIEPQYVDGDVFRTKNAAGALCLNKVTQNAYGNSNITIAMCVLDPDAEVLLTGGRLLATSAPVSGTGVAIGYNNPVAHTSVETWQPLSGRGACDPSGNQLYVYWAVMNTWNYKVQSSTVENGPLELTVQGMTDYPSALWGRGPGSGPYWIDSAIDTTSYIDDFLWNITSTPPPVAPTNPGAFLLV